MQAKTKASTRIEERPGIRVEMPLRGLGRKEFPFTVAMYDGQRVEEQKGRASVNQECALFVQLPCAVASGRSIIPTELGTACMMGGWSDMLHRSRLGQPYSAMLQGLGFGICGSVATPDLEPVHRAH